MPLYEYQCSGCKESFEKIVRFSESDQIPACPICGEKKVVKKISAAASISGSSHGTLSTSGNSPKGGFT